MSQAYKRSISVCAIVGVVLAGTPVHLRAQCQLPKLTASVPEEFAQFGTDVSISGDLAAIGAPNDNEGDQEDAGAVYIFQRNGVFWQEVARLVATDGSEFDGFGSAVALDGNVLIVGAIGADDGSQFNTGAAYIFTRDQGVWAQTAKLEEPGGGSGGDQFGFDVAVSVNVAIVGVFGDDDPAPNAGAAHIFRRQDGNWAHEQLLTRADAENGDRFGVSVAVDGNTAVAGAYWTDDAGSRSGSAYVFEREAGVWVEKIKLLADDLAADDQLGRSVAIHGDDIVVGSHLAAINLIGNVGAAYVFHRSGATWGQTQKLVAPDGALSDEFGRSVGIRDNAILIGAANRDWPIPGDVVQNVGAAYLYGFNGSSWIYQQTLFPEDLQADGQLGLALAVDGGWALVGARDVDLPGSGDAAGAIYSYFLNSEPDCDDSETADVCDIAGGADDCDANAVLDECEPDCDGNGQTDVCDLTDGADDCDGNGILDICEPDCNTTGTNDVCDISDGLSPDCNANMIPDECDVDGGGSEDCNADGVPNECETDCDGNGQPDACEISGGAPDCNANDLLDVCETDCNSNSIPDDCDLVGGTSDDCNTNATPDECDVQPGGGSVDCNANVIPDECEEDCNSSGAPDDCDIATGTSADCNGNGQPDECEQGAGQDCNLNTIPDECEDDCNGNNRPDDCDLSDGTSQDCNSNELPDECDIAIGVSLDCDTNGIPDECDVDCNGNSNPDACDINDGDSEDCDGNGVPDECDQDADPDCNANGTLDACETDCNANTIPDDCDLNAGTSQDCNNNEVPDVCDLDTGFSIDCNGNTVPDVCDVAAGSSDDCNGDESPDECDSLPLVVESEPLSPIGAGVPQAFVIPAAPLAAGPVTVTLLARADLESPVETLDVWVNGAAIGTLFDTSGNDCPDVLDVDAATVDPVTYNQLVGTQDAVFTVIASESVDPDPVLCDPVLVIRVSYQELFDGDCNLNEIPDDCELVAGIGLDCNENGVPDDCDLVAGVSPDNNGNAIPDECEANGDADDDGDVDLVDYGKFAACVTGPGGGILIPLCSIFDFDVDFDVDLVDYGGLQSVYTGP